jgi:hypothetical protein
MRRASVVILLAACLGAAVGAQSKEKSPPKTPPSLSPNVRVQTHLVLAMPDLLFQSVTVYKDEACTQPLAANEAIHPTATTLNAWLMLIIKNQGTTPANNFTLSVSGADEEGWSGISQNANGPFTRNLTLGPMSLGPGATSSLKIKWQTHCAQSTTQDDDRFVGFGLWVDNRMVVTESNEQNNSRTASFYFNCTW